VVVVVVVVVLVVVLVDVDVVSVLVLPPAKPMPARAPAATNPLIVIAEIARTCRIRRLRFFIASPLLLGASDDSDVAGSGIRPLATKTLGCHGPPLPRCVASRDCLI